MMKNYAIWGLILLLGVGGVGSVMGQEPDPAEVKRRMEIYMRDDPAEAKKSAPAPKPRPKPVVQPKPPTIDHDREAWKSAEKCGTTACFEAYLEDYPKGRYAKMARARLKSVEPEAPTVVPQAPTNLSVQPAMESITLGADFHFDFNQVSLKPAATAKLDKVSADLPSLASISSILIVGHADSKEIKPEQLGQKRAGVIAGYLTAKGVSRSLITIRSMGQAEPVAPNTLPNGEDNPAGRALNRRVVITVSGLIRSER